MRTETWLFAGSAAFFTAIGAVYLLTSYDETGTTLLIAGLAGAGLLSAFFGFQARRLGRRPEDRGDATPADGAGPIGYFPSESVWPPVIAAGAALAGLGLVFGMWPMIAGGALLAAGILGVTLQR